MTPNQIDNIFKDLDRKLERFKDEFGREFLTRVKQRTPVVTGHLRDSWGYEKKKDAIEIYNTAEYAAYVENGTNKMAPRAMLKTTALEKEQIAEVAKQRAGLK